MDQLYLIAGLGNPGRDYERTRHNAGFLVVEKLCEQLRGSWVAEKRFTARLARVNLGVSQVLLCEPLTFMNVSGEAVGKLISYFRIPLERFITVVDDADLPLGQIRLRPGGSSGGHHGLDSIESHLGSRDYARLRVGIGRTADGRRDIANHVLGKFGADEESVLGKVQDRCCRQLECWVTEGIGKAMSQFNGTVGPT